MGKTGFATLFIVATMLLNCVATRQVSITVRMMPEQEKYFKENILSPFEKKHKCRITVNSYDHPASLDTMLMDGAKNTILVKVPFEATRHVAETKLLKPIDSIVNTKEFTEIKNRYFLMQLAAFDGQTYYFPRKFETRIVVALKSKINEAIRMWGGHREAIDSVLKTYNGYGLPSGYTLEANPDEWDYFDVFVAGWYWARSDSTKFMPRIAHRSKRYSGTCQRLVDRIISLGGNSSSIMKMEGPETDGSFIWEALYAREKIYHPSMIKDGWSGVDIWNGFKKGEVYLAFMTQLDAFFIHGDDAGKQAGYIANPDDLTFAVMPKGVSLELSSEGKPLFVGTNSVSTGGWWWGIPVNSPDYKLSLLLAEWILASANQTTEASNFGMIPVRKDILSDIGLLFGRTWIADIYNTSLKQLVYNRYNTVPVHDKYAEVESIYLDAFDDIVIKGNNGPTNSGMISYIGKILEPYRSKAYIISNK